MQTTTENPKKISLCTLFTSYSWGHTVNTDHFFSHLILPPKGGRRFIPILQILEMRFRRSNQQPQASRVASRLASRV